MEAPSRVPNASSRPIIGRQAERARLREAIGHAASGAGAAVLITGEVGIGKSHLAREALALARGRGFLTLEGRCDALSQGLAYAPVAEALGRALRDLAVADRSRVLAGLPMVGRLVPGLELPPDEPTGDAALDRTRLFEGVLRLIDRLCRRSPVSLFVDDLHWADRSTLELLAYVTRDLAAMPLLLVVTWPVDTAGDAEPGLDAFRRVLGRDGMEKRVILDRLSDDNIVELVGTILGAPPDRVLGRLLAERCHGNALFAEALIGQLRDDGVLVRHGDTWTIRSDVDVPTPHIVSEILLTRARSLSAEGRRVLDAIAMGGDGIPLAILAGALDSDPGDPLEALVARDLVAEQGLTEPTYSIAHPLLREVVREAISVGERRRWHSALAEAYRTLRPEEVERLAVHAQRAMPLGDPVAVLDASLRAGEQALARVAAAEAVPHLEYALELARRHRPQAVATTLTLLAEARRRTGDRLGAAGTWNEAITALGADGDRREIAGLHLRAAIALGEAEFTEADHHAAAGLAALRGADGSELELQLLLAAATTAHRRMDRTALNATVERIVTTGAAMATDRGRAIVSAARLLVLLEERRYPEAEAELVHRHLLRAEDPLLTARHVVVDALLAGVRGDLPTLHAANERSIDVARQLGIPSWDFRLHFNLFVAALYAGDWDRADEVVAEQSLLAERTDDPLFSVGPRLLSALLAAYRADFAGAFRACRTESPAPGARWLPIRELSAAVQAIVELEQGASAAAASLLEGGRLPMGATMPPWDVVALGEARARLGRTRAAAEVSQQLAEMGPTGSWPAAMAARIDGLAAATDGRLEVAIERLEAAGAAFGMLSMPFEEARAGLEVAVLVGQNGPADGAMPDRLASWLATFEGLGAARYAGRARRILGRLGVTTSPPRPITIELTPRQLEIAELVATGMSNAEIAERLYLSVRTVTSHLDHIYTRLGVGSRAALAAYVVESRHRALPPPS